MTTHRPERVADLIRAILAGLIREELRDPRIGFATVTEVRVSPDLKHARIFVSKLGEHEELTACVEALNRASSFLRRGLGSRARLKYIPQLVFAEDTSIEQGFKVESLLHEIHGQHEGQGDAAPEPEDDSSSE